MASIEVRVRDLNARRLNIWENAKNYLDRINVVEGRELSADESATFTRMMDDISAIDRERDAILGSDEAARTVGVINEEAQRARWQSPDYYAHEDRRAQETIRDFFRPLRAPGRHNAIDFDLTPARNMVEAVRAGADGNELRLIAGDTGSSGGSLTIPTLTSSTIYAYMTASVAMRRIGCTIINTPQGGPQVFPKVSTHGIATQVATQNTAYSGTDPVLASLTMNAFDFGQLVAVSNDMLEDNTSDVLGFVAKNLARAVGQVTATAYIKGSGSGAPQGIEGAITGSAGAGTVASGGSLLLGPVGAELEKLIDVQYNIADSYRINGAAWLMRDLTGARVRKIRDGAGGTTGQFVWQPSPTVGAIGGQPDTFLGSPVFFDPNVASMASDAKTVFYGDWSAFYIRDTGAFRLERSDDLYFDKAQAAFRALLRTDSDLVDNYAITALHQAVS